MAEVVSAFKDTSDVKKVQSTGLHVAGEKFIVLKADDRSLYGKKVRLDTQLCSHTSVN
jgi:profilin